MRSKYSVRVAADLVTAYVCSPTCWRATLRCKVFASFIILLGASLGIVGWIGGAPFLMIVILFALETLVAFLQAYVFAILTCIYLNDAIHPGH